MNEGYLRLSQIATLTGIKRHAMNARAKSALQSSEIKRSASNQILLSPSQVRSLISDRLPQASGKVIYIGNLKGGVGKTTLAYLLTNAISSLGLKTCAIDLDVQSNLTRQYMEMTVDHPVFFDVVDNKLHIKDVTVEISENLHFIPSSLKNSLIQKSLTIQSPKHHLSWFNKLCLSYLRENYDVIIVDTPPSLTTLNSVFCLCLGDNDHIAIPACADEFSLMGVQMFLEDVFAIRSSYETATNPKFSIVMNRFFQNQKTNLEMLLKMQQNHPDILSETVIRDSAKIREVINNKTPIADLRNAKEVYDTISGLLQEFNIVKKIEA